MPDGLAAPEGVPLLSLCVVPEFAQDVPAEHSNLVSDLVQVPGKRLPPGPSAAGNFLGEVVLAEPPER